MRGYECLTSRNQTIISPQFTVGRLATSKSLAIRWIGIVALIVHTCSAESYRGTVWRVNFCIIWGSLVDQYKTQLPQIPVADNFWDAESLGLFFCAVCFCSQKSHTTELFLLWIRTPPHSTLLYIFGYLPLAAVSDHIFTLIRVGAANTLVYNLLIRAA